MSRNLVLVGKTGPAFRVDARVTALKSSNGAHGTIGTTAPTHLPRSGRRYGIARALENLMVATDDRPWAPCTDPYCGVPACPAYAYGDIPTRVTCTCGGTCDPDTFV